VGVTQYIPHPRGGRPPQKSARHGKTTAVKKGGFFYSGMRAGLESVLEAAKKLPCDELPLFLGELEAIKYTAMARLFGAAVALPASEEQLVDIDEAAGRLGMSPDYLYRNWRALPFAKKEGSRVLFSISGINEYIRRTANRY
jgi:hypothetical protein